MFPVKQLRCEGFRLEVSISHVKRNKGTLFMQPKTGAVRQRWFLWKLWSQGDGCFVLFVSSSSSTHLSSSPVYQNVRQ